MKLIYVGDPMCSWCYGISNELEGLSKHFENSIPMEVLVGGLRPGGGEEWNAQFTSFLKHHWEEVSSRSGMPFNYKILSSDNFNYDTEPACRSIVTVKSMNPEKVMLFFKATQKGFYYNNEDPKEVGFYKDICNELGLDFAKFKVLFESDAIKQQTRDEFLYAQKIGVLSFPTILLEKDGQLYSIAQGFSTKESMISRVNEYVNR